MKNSFFQYFFKSSLITAIALVGAYFLGGWTAVVIVATLSILEISLSFDNAVVNATVLSSMDEVWKKRFLTWGILIAVFGARLVIPIFIIALTAGINPISVFKIAFFDSTRYAALIHDVHIYVSGFGSAFLGMVFLKFFFDENKTRHWIPWIEHKMQKLGVIGSVQALIMLVVMLGFSTLLIGEVKTEYLVSSVWGIVIYLLIGGLTDLISPSEEKDLGPAVAKSGFIGFLYLEALDTSFSLDGVIGAFAITQNIVIILIGLTVGSFFVRSFTIYMVDKKALKQLVYLEHGAFWSVGILAACMLIKTIHHIPELLIVGLTVGVLIISIWHSYQIHKKEA